MTTSEAEEKIPLILDGKFFLIKTQKDNGYVEAVCLSCRNIYKGSLYATSNYLKHLKTKHWSLWGQFEKYKNETYTPPPKRKCLLASSASTSTSKLDIFFAKSSREQADDLVVDYIVSAGRPLTTVNIPAFKNLVNGLSKLKSDVTCLSKHTLYQKVDKKYDLMIESVKKTLQNAKYVCTTADIWSSFRRSYLGVTCHWLSEIENENCLGFERKSAALACRRFKGTHNYSAIGKMLCDIYESFGLSTEKNCLTVTDNGSNFVKAFREFKYNSIIIDEDGNDFELMEEDGEHEVNFTNFSELQEDVVNQDFDELYVLPKHHKCASHTLSLLASNDVLKAAKMFGNTFGKMYHIALSKCSAIWNLTNRSSNKASETYFKVICFHPKPPCPTRWNSQYDAISELLRHSNLLSNLCKALNLPPFRDIEIEFLVEFQKCLEPIAVCLDILQGEKNIFMGGLIPCIYAIDFKLINLESTEKFKYCKDLCKYLRDNLRKRFAYIFNLNDEAEAYILATVTLPKWKLKWIPAAKKDYVTNVFKNAVKNFEQNSIEDGKKSNSNEIEIRSSEIPSSKLEEDFFKCLPMEMEKEKDTVTIGNSSSSTCDSTKCELQVMQYLCDNDKSLRCLSKYGHIKQLFLKYNCGIPSSAPVERLFSYVGMILTPKRSTLSDLRFEKCTLLQANTGFLN